MIVSNQCNFIIFVSEILCTSLLDPCCNVNIISLFTRQFLEPSNLILSFIRYFCSLWLFFNLISHHESGNYKYLVSRQKTLSWFFCLIHLSLTQCFSYLFLRVVVSCLCSLMHQILCQHLP